MKKDYLLYLKKIATLGCLLTGIGSLTACGDKINIDNVEKVSEKDDVKFHEHLMIDINGTTYIFRECDEGINDIEIIPHYGYVAYRIYDKNDSLLINGHSYGDTHYNYVETEIEEQAIREIEEKSLEDGAVLYRGLDKQKN